MNKHKEFIKKAYNGELGLTMCSEWKEAIEKQYPEFKTQLEVGKWYTHDNGFLFCFTGGFDKDKDPFGYGLSTYGNWYDLDETEDGGWNGKELRPATKEEVEEALINEAKKRGFKEGVRIKVHADELDNPENTGRSLNIDGNHITYDGESLVFDCAVIFHNGKWAEIIETITKEEAEKQLGKKIV